MAVNRRFHSAVHALVLIASDDKATHTSGDLADSLKTNPVVVRRLLAALQKSGLIESRKGPSGGSRLAKPAKLITAAEIYRAIHVPPVKVVKSKKVSPYEEMIERLVSSGDKAMLAQLDTVTLASLVKKVKRK